MKFELKSFRHGQLILENHSNYKNIWNEVQTIIKSISDEDIIQQHESFKTPPKGLAPSLNKIFKEKFTKAHWTKEARIFNDLNYNKKKAWRVDFAKDLISVEVSFNHGEAIAWNLMKPTIASELNHVQKEIQTEIGIIICASKDLKTIGGFDMATGEYEKINLYLNPLRSQLTTPLVIIGLGAPESFKIEHQKKGNRYHGIIVKNINFQ
jgi:hypothetical protein